MFQNNDDIDIPPPPSLSRKTDDDDIPPPPSLVRIKVPKKELGGAFIVGAPEPVYADPAKVNKPFTTEDLNDPQIQRELRSLDWKLMGLHKDSESGEIKREQIPQTESIGAGYTGPTEGTYAGKPKPVPISGFPVKVNEQEIENALLDVGPKAQSGKTLPRFLYESIVQKPVQVLSEGLKNIDEGGEKLGEALQHPDPIHSLKESVSPLLQISLGVSQSALSPAAIASDPIHAASQAVRQIPIIAEKMLVSDRVRGSEEPSDFTKYISEFVDPETHINNTAKAFGVDAKALAKLVGATKEAQEYAGLLGEQVGSLLAYIAGAGVVGRATEGLIPSNPGKMLTGKELSPIPKELSEIIKDKAKEILSKEITDRYTPKDLMAIYNRVDRDVASFEEQQLVRRINSAFEKTPGLKETFRKGVEVVKSKDYHPATPEFVKKILGDFPKTEEHLRLMDEKGAKAKPKAEKPTIKALIGKIAEDTPTSAKIIEAKLVRGEELSAGEKNVMKLAEEQLTKEPTKETETKATEDVTPISNIDAGEEKPIELPPAYRKKIIEQLGPETETPWGKVKELSDTDLARAHEKLKKPTPLNEMTKDALDEKVKSGEITQEQADEIFNQEGTVNKPFSEKMVREARVGEDVEKELKHKATLSVLSSAKKTVDIVSGFEQKSGIEGEEQRRIFDSEVDKEYIRLKTKHLNEKSRKIKAERVELPPPPSVGKSKIEKGRAEEVSSSNKNNDEQIQSIIDRYEDTGEIQTLDDFVNEIESLGDDRFSEALDEYRDAQRESKRYGKRMDLEGDAGEELLKKVKFVIQEQRVTESVKSDIPPPPSVQEIQGEVKINEPNDLPELDASVTLEEVNEKDNPADFAQGFKYAATVSYPESLGEKGNYHIGVAYKELPTREELLKDVREFLEEEKRDLEGRGSRISDRDENILKAINKALEGKKSKSSQKPVVQKPDLTKGEEKPTLPTEQEQPSEQSTTKVDTGERSDVDTTSGLDEGESAGTTVATIPPEKTPSTSEQQGSTSGGLTEDIEPPPSRRSGGGGEQPDNLSSRRKSDKREPAKTVEQRNAEHDQPVGVQHRELPPEERNHRIEPSDEIVPSGEVSKIRANLQALKLLKELETEKRNASPEEKKILAKYVGWGGIPNVFNEAQVRLRDEWYKKQATPEQLQAYENWEKKFGKYYDEIHELLDDDEIRAATRSTINAHYTSREVIEHGLWALAERLGFIGGKVLEPAAGIGHIIGLMPEKFVNRSRTMAIELDSVTGRMLSKLYPNATVVVKGFEETRLPNNSQSLVITNVPFAAEGPHDPQYPKFSLHNYFFARSIDVLKPGGLLVAITSNSTMDNATSLSAREWIAKKADLVGAIRLPNNAFKANAGTEVTTDILVFRKKDGNPYPNAERFRNTEMLKVASGEVPLNEYFIKHPDMMLGRMSLEGKMYRGGEPALMPFKDKELIPLLDEAVKKFPEKITPETVVTHAEEADNQEADIAEEGVKEGVFFKKDNKIYHIENGLNVPIEGTAKVQRADSFIRVRDTLTELIRAQLHPASPDHYINELRKELNRFYDNHVKKYGNFADIGNRMFEDDPEYPLVLSLEDQEVQTVQETIKSGANKGQKREKNIRVYKKADIFTKRTLFPREEPTSAESIPDAMSMSLAYRNVIDPVYIAKLTNSTPEVVTEKLIEGNHAFQNPESGILETPDEYLSGQVRDKLRRAKAAAEDEPKYQKNVDALIAVQPKDLSIHEIGYRLGSNWLPTKLIEDFLSATLRVGADVVYVGSLNKYKVDAQSGYQNSINTDTWAGGGVKGHELVEDALNMVQTQVYDTIPKEGGGTTRVKNADKSLAAQAVQQRLQDAFIKYVKDNKKYHQELEKLYNNTYNGLVLQKFTPPSWEHYPGASTSITLREHQKAVVSRILQNSTGVFHAVGTGKTFIQITAAMEMRRLGLAKKPVLIVQNATVTQIAASAKKLYPAARILAPAERDRQAQNRQKLLSKIATSDWDIVVIPQSFASMIQDDPKRVTAYIQQELDELQAAKIEQAAVAGKKAPAVKMLEKAITALENRLKEQADRKVDETITFEQLGVDALFVDEAHAYKKLGFSTGMTNVKGIDTGRSERAFSMYMKTQYVQENNAGKNVVFLTGTPITNTMAEFWTMARFLRPDILKHYGIEKFDGFAGLFGEIVPQFEYTSTGRWKVVSRFAKYQNGPELIKILRTMADVVLADEIKLPGVPTVKGGKPTQIKIPRSEALKRFIDRLRETLEAWEKLTGREKREKSYIPLLIYNQAKQAAIDLRLIHPKSKDIPESKVNVAVDNVYDVWKKTSDFKGTQLVFSDMFQSPPTEEKYLDEEKKIPNPDYGEGGRFNLYQDIKQKLVKKGVPENQIVVMNDFDTDAKRAGLFKRINDGDVRIVMGSTEKMGIGVNVQQRLYALHHLDAPPRPMDLEQRQGRILRQGNENKEVEIFVYGVEQTLDATGFQRLATKQKFINQAMRGDILGRTFDDPADEVQVNLQELMAGLTGNPMALERFAEENKIRQLEMLQQEHNRKRGDVEFEIRNLKNTRIPHQKESIEALERAQQIFSENFPDGKITQVETETGTEVFKGDELSAKLEKYFTDKFAFALRDYKDHLTDVMNQLKAWSTILPTLKVNGVPVHFRALADKALNDKGVDQIIEWAVPKSGVKKEFDKFASSLTGRIASPKGFIQSFQKALEGFPKSIDESREHLANMEQEIIEKQKFSSQPFEQEDELKEHRTKLAEIEKALEAQSEAEKKADEEARLKRDREKGEEDVDNEDEGDSGTEAERIQRKPSSKEDGGIPSKVKVGAAELPFKLDHLDKIQPMMMPELIKLAQAITGDLPKLKRLRSNLGLFKHRGAESIIVLNRDIQGDPRMMAKVLAHEIGHGIDWMDDKTMKRGNLIGRLISATRTYMRNTFPVGYLNMPKGKELKKELQALSQWWKPFNRDADPPYTKYRDSSKELYADFLSVLLNAPVEAKERAPQFYKAFFEGLDKKQMMKNHFLRLQMLLANPALLGSERWEDITTMFKRGEDVMREQHLMNLTGQKSVWFHLKSALIDRNAQMLKARKAMIDAGRIEPIKEGDPRFALEENDTLSVHIQSYLRDLDPLLREINEKGTLDIVNGILFLDRIQAGDRWEFANPLGHIPGTAGEQLRWLEKKYGDKYTEARKQVERFHKWFEQINDLMAEDMLTPEQASALHATKDTYATFRVVKYMKDWVSSGLIHQKGTFEDIGSPLTATVLKAVSMIRAARRNQFKKEIANQLLQNRDLFKEHVKETGKEYDTVIPVDVNNIPGQVPYVKPHANPNLGVIMWKDGGKWKAAHVDKYIVNSFEYDSSSALANAASVSKLLLNNSLWRPLLITLSPGFQLRNIIRDFSRTYKGLSQKEHKKTVLDLLKAYRDAIPAAKSRAKGEYNELIKKMEKEHALNVTLSELMRSSSGEEDELQAVLHKYGLDLVDLKPGWQKTALGKGIFKVWDAIQYLGNVVETVPKVAAYNLLDDLPARERALWIRNFIGTPNPKRRGTAYMFSNNLILFSNINKEGWRSDFELGTMPTTRSGWWWRTIKMGIVPKILFRLAMLGLFGAWLKSWSNKEDKYARRQNILIPLGETDQGKAVSLQIPNDESTRIVSGLFDIALDVATADQTAAKGSGEALKFFAGQVPFVGGAHPMITIGSAWADYLNGKMPRDAFRGYDILTEDELKAGGAEAWTPMAKWTLDRTGLIKLDVHDKFSEEPTWEKVFRTVPGANALIGITNMGEYERMRQALEEVQADEARERIERKKNLVESAKSGESVSDFLTREYKGKTLAELKSLYKMRQRVISKGTSDPLLRAITQATSNEQKRAVILAGKGTMNDEEYKTLMDEVEERGIVSKLVKFDSYIDWYRGEDSVQKDIPVDDVIEAYKRMPPEIQAEMYPLLTKKVLNSKEFRDFSKQQQLQTIE